MPLNEYEFPQNKLANVQGQLEKLVAKNYYLHTSAREAYRSYILSYNSHQLKEARKHTHTYTRACMAYAQHAAGTHSAFCG